MIVSNNPATLRPVPDAYSGIYAHATMLNNPDRLFFFSGQVGIAMDGKVASSFSGQCHQAMDHVEALLTAHDLDLNNILKVTYYLTRTQDITELTHLRQRRWHANNPPAITTLLVAGLVSPDWLIEIDVIAGA